MKTRYLSSPKYSSDSPSNIQRLASAASPKLDACIYESSIDHVDEHRLTTMGAGTAERERQINVSGHVYSFSSNLLNRSFRLGLILLLRRREFQGSQVFVFVVERVD